MQILAANPVTFSERISVARSAVVGAGLVALALLAAWVVLGTDLMAQLVPSGRPSEVESLAATLVWGLAIAVPGLLGIAGLAKLLGSLESFRGLHPGTITPQLARLLGQDHLAATGFFLPEGRRVHELIVGPFGVVVLGDVPPPDRSRIVGDRWEVSLERGRWVAVEPPIERAVRDAERVRAWLRSADADVDVRVYAAVVSTDRRLARTPTCAVLAPRELRAWIAALPVQRGLAGDRLARLAELVREAAIRR